MVVHEPFQALGSGPFGLSPIVGAPGIEGNKITALSENGVTDFIQSLILDKNSKMEEPFFVLGIGVLVDLMDKWSIKLPMVQPFYAVKCNPNPTLLHTMAALGSSFDCTSRAKIESILALEVLLMRIIYANPCVDGKIQSICEVVKTPNC